ncbi:MAG: hypothetical protein ACLUED_06055 [Lachnospira eligens]
MSLIDFTYADQKLSNFGYMPCSFDSSDLSSISFGSNTIKNSVNENTSAIIQVTMSANGNNLLRNSDTLIFDEYIIGSKLIDASNNILVDRNGYILVG